MKYTATNALKQILLDTIHAAQAELSKLENIDWKKIVDNTTNDEDTRSIQTILTHMLASGYRYLNYIAGHLDKNTLPHKKELLPALQDYKESFQAWKRNVEYIFGYLYDDLLEQQETSKKILTDWGQYYDIEQLLEHAIVHNLRHLLQIRKYMEY